MGDLRKNFDWCEFACACCGEVQVDDVLADSLQTLRELSGQPISLNSGYRCKKHNEAVGGADTSQHLVGKAADIVIAGHSVNAMYALALLVPTFFEGGVGIYPDKGFIHVDVRGVKSRWSMNAGRDCTVEDALIYKGGA